MIYYAITLPTRAEAQTMASWPLFRANNRDVRAVAQHVVFDQVVYSDLNGLRDREEGCVSAVGGTDYVWLDGVPNPIRKLAGRHELDLPDGSLEWGDAGTDFAGDELADSAVRPTEATTDSFYSLAFNAVSGRWTLHLCVNNDDRPDEENSGTLGDFTSQAKAETFAQDYEAQFTQVLR